MHCTSWCRYLLIKVLQGCIQDEGPDWGLPEDALWIPPNKGIYWVHEWMHTSTYIVLHDVQGNKRCAHLDVVPRNIPLLVMYGNACVYMVCTSTHTRV